MKILKDFLIANPLVKEWIIKICVGVGIAILLQLIFDPNKSEKESKRQAVQESDVSE